MRTRSTFALMCSLALVAVGLPIAGVVATTTPAAAATTVPIARASVSSAGAQANGASNEVVMSNNGRYLAFASTASNLVSGDTNGKTDVFVRDLKANTTTRVSVTNTGGQANGDSDQPSISADGRYVVFHSRATNLVSTATSGTGDVFVRDRVANTTTLVSTATNGSAAGQSERPRISADGTHVAFISFATNVITPAPTNKRGALYLRDRSTGSTIEVGPSIGCPSEPIFDCNVGDFRMDDAASSFVIAFHEFFGSPDAATTFIYTLASLGASPVQRAGFDTAARVQFGEPQFVVSGDGREVYWNSCLNFSNCTLNAERDGGASQTIAYPLGRPIFLLDASRTGRYLITGTAVPGPPGTVDSVHSVMWFDVFTRELRHVSPGRDGRLPDADAIESAATNNDGSVVAFSSLADNHVNGDTNGAADVFTLQRAVAPVVPLPTLHLTSQVLANEPGSGTNLAIIQARLSGPFTFVAHITWSTQDGTATAANGDYTPTSAAPLTVPGFEEIRVPVLADHVSEGNETFTVHAAVLDDAQPAVNTSTVTILPPSATPIVYGEQQTFSESEFAPSPGTSTGSVGIFLSEPSTNTVTLTVAPWLVGSSGPHDFAAPVQHVSLFPLDRETQLTFTAADDKNPEPTDEILFTFSPATNAISLTTKGVGSGVLLTDNDGS